MNKELYFYFYTRRDLLYNQVNQIHFKCLRHYKDVFDNIFICIALDDVYDKSLIKEAQNIFFDIFAGKNITFKIIENDVELRENKLFIEEILNKLETIDVVFFGHNAYSTYDNIENDIENLSYAIIGLYGALENKNVFLQVTKQQSAICGSYFMPFKNRHFNLKNFVIINGRRLLCFLRRNESKITIKEISDLFSFDGDTIWLSTSSTPSFLDFRERQDFEPKNNSEVESWLNFLYNIQYYLDFYLEEKEEIKNKILD